MHSDGVRSRSVSEGLDTVLTHPYSILYAGSKKGGLVSIAWVLVHMRDTITQNQGNRYCERKNLVRLLGICSVILISMTKAVAYAAGSYAFHCLGQEGFHTSLRLSSTSTMVGLSSQAAVGSTIGSTKTCHNLYGTKLKHPDHTTIIEVDKGLLASD